MGLKFPQNYRKKRQNILLNMPWFSANTFSFVPTSAFVNVRLLSHDLLLKTLQLSFQTHNRISSASALSYELSLLARAGLVLGCLSMLKMSSVTPPQAPVTRRRRRWRLALCLTTARTHSLRCRKCCIWFCGWTSSFCLADSVCKNKVSVCVCWCFRMD